MQPSRPESDSPMRSGGRTGKNIVDRKARMLALFRKFDISNSGILDLTNINSMVKAILVPTSTSKRNQTKNVASIILQSLDKDKSGGVDQDEFVTWVTKGAELQPEQRIAFAASGHVQTAILNFLEAVEECLLTNGDDDQNSSDPSSIYTQDDAINDVVKDLFLQFDVDQDGHIEKDELCAMLMEVCLTGGLSTGYEATYDAAAKVLDILDTDGSGSIEPEELVTWVREGMTLSPEARRNFSKTSTEKTSLIRFLASIEEMIADKLRVRKGPQATITTGAGKLGGSMNPAVWNAVSKIFKRYDEDGSGAIDASELSSMIKDLNSDNDALSNSTEFEDLNVLKTATDFVMENLCGEYSGDTEGENLLTLNAFAAWVEEGVKLTPAERKAFARSGKNKAVLIRFLRTVEDEITTPSQSTEENEDPNNLDVKSYESQLIRAISDVFNQYDSDGSGAIDLEELSAMITEVQVEEGVPAELIDHEQSKQAGQSVMKILIQSNTNDADQEPYLTLPKFKSWLLKGIKMTSLQRKAFAKARPVNAVLARFLRAVERLARQYTNDTPISRAVRFVFVKYDVDGSGLIDEQELSAIITDLINGDGGTKIGIKAATDASRQMMKMLAGSENVHKLSEEAFLGWVHKGSQMPGDKRRGFAKGSEARRAMILLLRTVEIIARQEEWTPRKMILHKLFQKYDVDGSGHIDTPELAAMMCDIVNQLEMKEASECAGAVVSHLDSSGNNLLEEEEFFSWLDNGTKMSASDRDQLRKGGDSKANLVKFLEGVERVITENQ